GPLTPRPSLSVGWDVRQGAGLLRAGPPLPAPARRHRPPGRRGPVRRVRTHPGGRGASRRPVLLRPRGRAAASRGHRHRPRLHAARARDGLSDRRGTTHPCAAGQSRRGRTAVVVVVTGVPLRAQALTRRVPAPLLVLAAVVSVQFGGALAATLVPLVGVFGSVTLRLTVAAAVLLVMVRPRLRGRTRGDWLVVGTFGAVLAMMNLFFYGSLARLPIGVAVTIEFIGPLVLATVLSRRPRDLIAVAGAAVGVLLISG